MSYNKNRLGTELSSIGDYVN